MSSLDQDLIPIEESRRYVSETPTPYEDRSCGKCRIAYFPIGKFTICGHWICAPLKPFLVSISFLLLSALCFYNIWTFSPSLASKIGFSIFYGFCTFCLIMAYFEVIVIGPGYLPFNYKTNKIEPFLWENAMESIVVYREQMEYARESERPPRTSFAISARRFVLRADHYCFWTESWIGLKNARYFLVMLFWVIMTCISWFCVHTYWFMDIAQSEDFKWQYVLGIIGHVAIGCIFFLSCYHCFLSTRDLCNNWTSLERWKNRTLPVYDQGCMSNFEEVCGARKFCPLWIFPCFISQPLQDGFYA
ncbi:DHHC zinc finger domain containing protein [Tritrichomonas foetus]|uniref:Palmitoyltransferase n=1 Tax=Tritrichomonas foetus TaxID=1144522 RepID=A0A1J4L3N6_9EUKA|nr:DHHC zinc finger domain containing protein [Tritrichomonas foetus]|eukprot:OHT16533.1 DHHC zinc finger domain containing protein [Tritrichomonas foetus]